MVYRLAFLDNVFEIWRLEKGEHNLVQTRVGNVWSEETDADDLLVKRFLFQLDLFKFISEAKL